MSVFFKQYAHGLLSTLNDDYVPHDCIPMHPIRTHSCSSHCGLTNMSDLIDSWDLIQVIYT